MVPWVALLDRHAQAFAAVLGAQDLRTAVPTCPGWNLAELAEHLGEVHQWAAHAIRAGNPDAVFDPSPSGRDELVAWYLDCAAELIDLLRTTPPEAPAWGFGPKPRTVAFWLRRQAHETAMHLYDAQAATGIPDPIEAGLALDGIDEVLTVFFPRQVRLGRIPPLLDTLALQPIPDSGSAASQFVLSGDGTTQPAEHQLDATVTGPPQALLLLLWNRITLDDVRLAVAGDRRAAARVLAAGIVP